MIYTSFKYGEGTKDLGGRFFTEFTEETILPFWKSATPMNLFDLWITNDARAGRKQEKWLNLMARR